MGPVGHAHVTIDQLQIHGTRPYAAGRIERIGPRTNQRVKKRQKEIDICLNCPSPTCSSNGSGTCPILLKGKEKAEVNNEDIRSAIKSAGLKTKQVYEALHIPHSTWSLWMHRELSAEFREKIFQTIAELKRPKEILDTYDLSCCRRCCNRAMCERDKLTCSTRAKEQGV